MVEHVSLENPNGDDLEFAGELVVDERNHDVGFIKVWRTKGGRYVLRQRRATRPGIFEINRVVEFNTAQELAESLGHSPGAKAVARKLGLPRTIQIE